jgi:CBS domain-containing protein
MKARELMTANPECLTADEPISRASRMMRDLDVGMIPIVEDTSSCRLKGVVTDRDLVVRHLAENHADDHAVGDDITDSNLHTVSADDDADRVLRMMRENQIRRVLVTDGDNCVKGVIAEADVATHLGPMVTGQIIAEVSQPAQPVR